MNRELEEVFEKYDELSRSPKKLKGKSLQTDMCRGLDAEKTARIIMIFLNEQGIYFGGNSNTEEIKDPVDRLENSINDTFDTFKKENDIQKGIEKIVYTLNGSK